MDQQSLTKDELLAALSGLATKDDLAELATKSDIQELRAEIAETWLQLNNLSVLVKDTGDFIGEQIVERLAEEHHQRISRLERHTNHPPVAPRLE